jgi:hypothetical protein
MVKGHPRQLRPAAPLRREVQIGVLPPALVQEGDHPSLRAGRLLSTGSQGLLDGAGRVLGKERSPQLELGIAVMSDDEVTGTGRSCINSSNTIVLISGCTAAEV